jgi:hypothetical protein
MGQCFAEIKAPSFMLDDAAVVVSLVDDPEILPE